MAIMRSYSQLESPPGQGIHGQTPDHHLDLDLDPLLLIMHVARVILGRSNSTIQHGSTPEWTMHSLLYIGTLQLVLDSLAS